MIRKTSTQLSLDDWAAAPKHSGKQQHPEKTGSEGGDQRGRGNWIRNFKGANNLSGIKFGKLVAKERVGSGNDGSATWRCVCECGKEKTTRATYLRRGVTRSCGCMVSQRAKTRNIKAWNKGQTYNIKNGSHVYRSKHAWAKAVRKKLGKICVLCGWDKAPCDVHHKIRRSKGGRNTICNGIVLCPNCHRLAHRKQCAT